MLALLRPSRILATTDSIRLFSTQCNRIFTVVLQYFSCGRVNHSATSNRNFPHPLLRRPYRKMIGMPRFFCLQLNRKSDIPWPCSRYWERLPLSTVESVSATVKGAQSTRTTGQCWRFRTLSGCTARDWKSSTLAMPEDKNRRVTCYCR